ncbi:MAG: DUF2807 domain-containing protein [Chitinophagaceae bacterium]|nr:DUF2807 domain-containing protein [Chitinophagaceae bacterium]
MNKQIFTMAGIVIGLCFSSCSKIKGDGPVITESRAVKGFSRIRAAMSGDIYVRQDSVYKVEIHAQKNIIDVLNTNVNDGQLKIDFDHNKRIGNHDRIEIFISCPNVEGLSVSGSGNITAMNKLTPSAIDLNVSGSGTLSVAELSTGSIDASISGSGDIVVLNGQAAYVNTDISGSGYLDLMGVAATAANTRISGSGDTKVNVSDELSVKISGSGDVYYRGRPRITTNISGSGKLIAQ